MEKYLHNSYTSYFDTLKKIGYINDSKASSLIILTFIYDLVYHDYRGLISRDDYNDIEKAVTCLFGSNCLLPYKDYLKMGRLHIGDITELRHKICEIETLTGTDISAEIQNSVEKMKDNDKSQDAKISALEDKIKTIDKVIVKPKDTVMSIDEIVIDNSK